jgi:hypothetical protein
MNCVTVLGQLVLLVPELAVPEQYRVISFNRNGQWQSATEAMPLEQAKRERTKRFAWHRKIAANRAAGRPDY